MSLRRGISWTLLGFAVWSACNFLMQIVLGHFFGAGGKSALGIYGTASALSQPFLDLGAFGLTSIYVGRAAEGYKFEDFLGLRIAMMIAVTIGLGIWTLVSFPGNPYVFWTTMVFMFGCICDRSAWMFFAIYQREEKLKNLGVSQSIRGILSLLLFCIGGLVFHSVLVAVLGSTIASIGMIFLWDWPNASRVYRSVEEGKSGKGLIRPRMSWQISRSLLGLSAPIAISIFLDSFSLQYPRQHLAQQPSGQLFLGQLAAYSFAITIGQLGVQAVATSIAPRLGTTWSEQRISDFVHILKIGFGLCALFGLLLPVIAYFVGGPILSVILNKSFSGDPYTFAIVALSGSMIFLGTVIGTGLTAARQLKFQGLWKAPGAVLCLVLSLLLIPKYHVLGAAYVLLAVGIVKVCYGGVVLLLAVRKQQNQQSFDTVSL